MSALDYITYFKEEESRLDPLALGCGSNLTALLLIALLLVDIFSALYWVVVLGGGGGGGGGG